MSFNFVEKVFNIGGTGNEVPTLQFFRKGFRIGSGKVTPTWQDIILHGNTALTLVNAKENSLEYLKLFGGTEFVPETYLDTVTLSGGTEQVAETYLDTVTLDGATRQSNVPEGYTEVEYLESTGTQWINTGYYPNTNTKFEISGTQGSTDCALFGLTLVFYCFNNSSVTTYYGFCGDSGSFNFVMKNVPVVLNMSASDGIVINGTKYIDLIAGSETANYPMALFGRMDNSTGRIAKLGDHIIRYAKIYENNILIHNYIPCRRNSDNVLGMYDTVTGNFLTNAGSGSFTAGADVTTPTPDYPIDIVCNNGAIKVSPNLFDKNNLPARINAYFGSSGTTWSYTVTGYSLRFPCLPNTTYTARYNGNSEQAVLSFASTNNDNIPTSSSNSITVTQAIRQNNPTINTPITLTTGANDKWLIVQYNAVDPQNTDMADNLQIQVGSRATSYMPYGIYINGTVETVTDSNQLTASAERLLAVGSYKDTQEVLSGAVTRKIGIKVFDGTEDWSLYNSQNNTFSINISETVGQSNWSTRGAWCSHFLYWVSAQTPTTAGTSPNTMWFNSSKDLRTKVSTDIATTAAGFKQWLAEQYAQGTPVIIVYPLATATTSTVSKQLLQKSPVTQTAGSISNMTITTTESSHTTPTPDNPLYLKCNNGVVKVSPNKYNASTRVEGYSISASGVVGPAYGFCYSALIPVKPNTTYILSAYQNAIGGANKRVHAYDSNGDWLQQLGVVGVTGEKSYSLSFTTTATTKYIRISISMNDTTVQVEEGSIATSYMPYGQIYTDGTQEVVTDSVGNTANAERLLAVGDYKDTQEMLNGSVARQIGIKVLDGTESWTQGTLTFYVDNIISNIKQTSDYTPYCSHYAGYPISSTNPTQPDSIKLGFLTSSTGLFTQRISIYDSRISSLTVAQFKQWLADQYANGTPVTIVYPLATATTETVTGQFLSKSPVTQTAGSISNLPIAITESSHTTPAPQQPLQINCNNGVVKVSKNLYNNTSTVLHLASDNYTLVENNERNGRYIKVNPSTTYTISKTSSAFLNICETTQIPTVGLPVLYTAMGTVATYTLTTSATTQYLYIYSGTLDSITTGDIQVEEGSTATSYHPYGQIYVDGTTETVESHSKNLFDETWEQGAISFMSNRTYELCKVASTMRIRVVNEIYLDHTKTYTISINNPDLEFCIQAFDEQHHLYSIQSITNIWVTRPLTFTGAYGVAIALRYKIQTDILPTEGQNAKIQIEEGSTATTYEPYFNGGSATAENLFKVGDYQDVQSVIDGSVTRNIGIKVLDGTESWTRGTAIYADIPDLDAYLGHKYCYCTHFLGVNNSQQGAGLANSNKICVGNNTNLFQYRNSVYIYGTTTDFPDVTTWTNWLADQYSNGTPVILVYPTNSPTTETVTGQPMNIQAGTNVVEITQASMDNLELEVKYKAGVEVTIEEIEGAQLDDNVEVTING